MMKKGACCVTKNGQNNRIYDADLQKKFCKFKDPLAITFLLGRCTIVGKSCMI